jgi:hypothetical protein
MNNNLFDNLSYKGTLGKRKPRNFVIAGILIVIGLAAIGGVSAWFARAGLAQIKATPRPILAPTFTPTPALPTPEPTSVNGSSGCPTDSADWNLVDVFQNNNYKRIDPACVYEGLNKPIAWILAAQGAGYTNPAVLHLLGYSGDPPYANNLDKIDLLPVQGNKPVALTTSWPPLHKDYRDWFIVNDVVVSERITLDGCYRTSETVGNQTQYWSPQWANSGASVICELAEDRLKGWDVAGLDGLIYSKPGSSATRCLAYFVYDNRPEYRSWYFVGDGDTFNMTVAELERTQSNIQKSYGSSIWDLAWLQRTYRLSPVPPPQQWKQHATQEDFNKILALLNQ